MGSDKEAKLDLILEGLANEHRRKMLHILAFSPATVSELATECDLSLPAIHKHINLLIRADLIRRQKVGRVNFVALNPDALHSAQKWLQKYQTYWGNRRETLENFISRYQLTSDLDSSAGENKLKNKTSQQRSKKG